MRIKNELIKEIEKVLVDINVFATKKSESEAKISFFDGVNYTIPRKNTIFVKNYFDAMVLKNNLEQVNAILKEGSSLARFSRIKITT